MSGNILIVDDVADNIRVLGNILKNRGYSIITATSGEQGINIARAKKPDLILLDIQMPGMDGFQVCKTLRAGDETRDIPVIFLTARTETDDLVRGFDMGGVDYITKPFNTPELIARVSLQIELKKLRDEQACLIEQLKKALDEVKTLSGLLPICASCKKIRNDTGYWEQIENYISAHSEAQFTHSLCPDCVARLYPDFHEGADKDKKKGTV